MAESTNPINYHETSLRKVYFADTDAAGVVHHSQYIRWFEAGRIDFLDDMGCTYAELQKEHIGFVPININVSYKNPLRFGDFYKIKTGLKQTKQASIIIHAQILSHNNILCCEAEVTLACMNEKNWSIIKVPERFKSVIQKTKNRSEN